MIIQKQQCGSSEFDSLSDSLPHLDKKEMTILLRILMHHVKA